MTVYRYNGRQPGIDDPSHSHGPSIIETLGRAEIGLIDDPLSFPWELVSLSMTCPLVVDLAGCSTEQIIGLRPALSCLTSSDTICDRSDPNSSATKRLARILGVRSSEPTDNEHKALGQTKRVDLAEQAILDRLRDECFTVVIDADDLLSNNIDSTDLSGDTPVLAIAVRVPGDLLRSARRGLPALAATLGSPIHAGALRGVWGIRSAPGASVERGVLVLEGPASSETLPQ